MIFYSLVVLNFLFVVFSVWWLLTQFIRINKQIDSLRNWSRGIKWLVDSNRDDIKSLEKDDKEH